MAETNNPSESDHRHLVRGGLAAFAIKIVAVVLGFTTQFLIARYLGQSGYGEFSFALVTLNFLVIAAVAGGDSVATRFVAVFRDSPALLRQCLAWLQRRATKLACAVLIIALVTIGWVRVWDDRAIWGVTQVLCLAIPFQVYSALRQGILRGRLRPGISQIPEEIVRPGLTIITLLLAAGIWGNDHGQLTPVYVAVIVVLVSMVVLVVGQRLLKREMTGVADSGDPQVTTEIENHWQQWRSMALASTLAAVAMTIHSQCDIWMLGVMVESREVGPYSAAARYAVFVVFGINAVNTALGPLVAKSADDRKRLQQLASRAAGLSFLLGIGVVLLLLSIPEYLLGWFGKGFDQASTPLRLLAVSNLFNVLCGSVGMLLSMSGHHRDFVRILSWSMVLNIGLNAILIPFYSTLGAALATATSTAFWNVLGWILVRKRLGIRPTLGGWI